jgi:hypothetical protein
VQELPLQPVQPASTSPQRPSPNAQSGAESAHGISIAFKDALVTTRALASAGPGRKAGFAGVRAWSFGVCGMRSSSSVPHAHRKSWTVADTNENLPNSWELPPASSPPTFAQRCRRPSFLETRQIFHPPHQAWQPESLSAEVRCSHVRQRTASFCSVTQLHGETGSQLAHFRPRCL